MSPDAGTEVVSQAAPAVQQAVQQQPAVAFIWWLFVALALTIVFFVVFIRALPWSEKFRSSKPLSCSVCVTGWLVIGIGVWLGYSTTPWFSVLHTLPAGGAALLLLGVLNRLGEAQPLPPPPGS